MLICPSDVNGNLELDSGPLGPQTASAEVGFVYPANYLGVSGETESAGPCGDIDDASGVLFTNSKIRLRDVTDGLSKTMVVGERGIPRDLTWGLADMWWHRM